MKVGGNKEVRRICLNCIFRKLSLQHTQKLFEELPFRKIVQEMLEKE